MGVSEFQSVCEFESGQDLDWFFEQWVHSNKCLSYEIAAQKCDRKGALYTTEVQVKCLGSLKMPVPVTVSFEDGTSQQAFTNRLRDLDVLRFESRSPLIEVRLDPEGALAMVAAPAPDAQELAKLIDELPWVRAVEKALAVFKQAKEGRLSDSDAWFKLGMTLYDGQYYQEGLEAFRSSQAAAKDDTLMTFTDTVWQGHLLDLLGQRDQAVSYYQEALDMPEAGEMRHDQYHMRLNREWVRKRLQEPFRRE